MNRGVAMLLLFLLLSNYTAVAEEVSFSPAEIEYFEKKVRPLLSAHCYSCHSAQSKTVHGGLLLDSRDALLRGGDSGPALIPGQPNASLLVDAVRYDGDYQMPPKGKLAAHEIEELTRWVTRGAPMPDAPAELAHPGGKIDFEAAREFWSFRPVQQQTLPEVAKADWPRTRVDTFVLSAMEKAGLTPSPQADRAMLLRRLYFDLTGLPPAPEELQEFLADDSPDAYPQLVDRLLASPHYGEKWGRMWLDMARYTDKSASWLKLDGQPHLYRDWVVRAFNEDLPYDEFIHRQLATDLMEETGPEDLPALGFISLSPTYWKELKLPCELIKVIVADEWEERVDAVSRTFLGLTVACARCHDHKFDPISSEDYYALAGVFASSRHVELPLIPEEQFAPVRAARAEVARLEAEVAKLKKEKPQPEEKLATLAERIQELRATPQYDTPMANALSEESLIVERAGKLPQDGTKLVYHAGPQDLPLFIRGNPNRPGPIVPRRFLRVLAPEQTPFEQGSGRLELAHAITTQAAPLAARVLVNRIWLGHFGKGLVATPSDFGTQGSPPTHPALLDDLAARFISGGWSIKRLHREILLSATWQQSSHFDEHRVAVDPENVWLSRMDRRRLDFESWRDSMLSASGLLDRTIGGPSLELDDPKNVRRTLYSTVHRHEMSTTLQIHDFPDPGQHSPQRLPTTTSLQGLYALNGPLLSGQSQALVHRLQREYPEADDQQVIRAYELLFARAPTLREQELAREFLGERASEDHAVRWLQYAHVLLASNELLFID